ncbi:MAG: hypothetical protein Q9222_005769 [Ikaeria aurantiellina]
MAKTSIIIVPDFWGHPSAFDRVVADLEAHNWKAIVIQLPSWGCEPPKKTMLDDAQAVRSEVTSRIKLGDDVVIVMHSAGGFIAPESLQGLLAPDVARTGGIGGVISLVYIAAPCMSIGEAAPPAPWFEYKGEYLWIKNPKQTLYSDLSDAEAEMWSQRIKHHPAHNYTSKTTQEPWRRVPCVYLKTAKDEVIPMDMQTAFSQKIPNCEVHECQTGHSPFLSQPSEVASAISKAVEMGKGSK